MHAQSRAQWRIPTAVAVIFALAVSMLIALTDKASATFPGSEGKIAFSRGGDEVFNIWSVSAAGGDETQLTSSDKDTSPAWSPDGTKIGFISKRDGSPELFVMDGDGGNETKLTANSSGGVYGISWSADQKYLAYSKTASSFNGYDIFRVDVNTKAVQLLTGGVGDQTTPALSPDGTMLAYTLMSRTVVSGVSIYKIELIVADADGSNPRSLATRSDPVYGVNVFDLDWSPDSSMLGWSYRSDTGRYAVIGVTGNVITDQADLLGGWTWSPDGTRFVRGVYRDGSIGLWLSALDGTPLTRISNLPGQQGFDDQPSWQSVGTTVMDWTKPAVTITSPTEGLVVTQGDAVNAGYACTDDVGGSGIASCNGDVNDGSVINTSTVGANTFTVTATDNRGNVTTKTVNYTVNAPPDVTKPTITITTPEDGSSFTQGTTHLADYACSDSGSGVVACEGDVSDGIPIDTSTVGAKTFTVTATDGAGNSDTKTVSYSVVAPPPSDTSAPVITVTRPVEGGEVLVGSTVTAQYSCDDGTGVGVVSCVGTVDNGALIDTSSIGTKTFTVSTMDAANNSDTKTVTYRVIWKFSGFTGPVNPLPTLNIGKSGSVVPVKFSLGGDKGMAIMASGYPKSNPITCESTAQTDGIEETGSPGGNVLSYDAANDTYGYNWKTDKAWKNTCRQFVLKLADGATYRANFKFL